MAVADSGLIGRPLTAREVRIMELVADGLTNAEIGARTHVAANTIKSQLYRIAEKLGTGRRSAMVAILFRQGIIR